MPWGGRPFSVRVLSDEAGQYVLVAACPCGQRTEIDQWELAKKVGWDVELEVLAKRFRCRKCGKRECKLIATPPQKPRRYKSH